MPRYFIRLSYKGTAFAGWQIQENAVSIQGKINEVLSLLCGTTVETTGCGRTDTGVHASRFYAHFDTDQPIPDPGKIMFSANAILPHDIAVKDLFEVRPADHARYDATERTYEYLVTTVKNPFLKEFALYLSSPPDIELMNKACVHLIGIRDFSCFSKSNSGTKNFVCDIRSARWEQRDDMIVFTISANRFLRGMVRAIVGTMLETGTGKMEPDQIKDVIASGNRSEAGASAPACGLFLCKIDYPFISDAGKGNLYSV